MAITRCPYCHAIIDENDKYCNNCGTQLLFPEDDEADEEIPGEKILDAEVEEKDYTVDEPEEEKRPAAAADDDEDVDERLEEEMKDRAAETALDEIVAEGAEREEPEDVTEEVILVDELEDAGDLETAGTGEIEAETETRPTGDVGGEEEEPEGEGEDIGEPETEDEAGKDVPEAGPAEIEAAEEGSAGPVEPQDTPDAAEEEPDIEYITETNAEDDAVTDEVPSPRPVTFDTKELEGIGRTVELGKDKVDELLEGLAERKPAEAPAPPVAETPEEPTGTLPPWASGMKGAPTFPPDTTPAGPNKALRAEGAAPAEEEEVEIFPRRRPSDSTLGLPERIAQSPLPFGRDDTEEVAAEEEPEDDTAETTAAPAAPGRPARQPAAPEREPASPPIESLEEYEESEARGPFSFAVFLKSKAFDVLFVGLFWLVALWLAAHATDRTLFEVLGAVSGPMFLLYAVFVLLYFFLFKFFLGETLGDRLFRPRD